MPQGRQFAAGVYIEKTHGIATGHRQAPITRMEGQRVRRVSDCQATQALASDQIVDADRVVGMPDR